MVVKIITTILLLQCTLRCENKRNEHENIRDDA